MTIKLTTNQFKNILRESVIAYLSEENIAKDLLPGADGKLSAYTAKINKFLEKISEEAEELAVEGEELMKADYAEKNPSIGERNRLILNCVGLVRKLRTQISQLPLELRKMIG